MIETKQKIEQELVDKYVRRLDERKHPIKPFSELNLIDDFMFNIATMDLELCKDIVELSLNIKIREIRWKEGQKVIYNIPGKRGIRLDFYIVDENGKVYDVEMQASNKGNIPKRTRYYKALLDSPMLKSGEEGFDALPVTYVIFICGFDLFGYGKYRYTFENRCREVPELVLPDELHTVILNTRGTNETEVESSLVDFLKFVENSSQKPENNPEDRRIRRIYEKVSVLKGRIELEAEYMKMEDRDRMIHRDGEEMGERNKLCSIIVKKLNKGKSIEEIADAVEEEVSVVEEIISELIQER